MPTNLICKRCGHSWFPQVSPGECVRCKRPARECLTGYRFYKPLGLTWITVGQAVERWQHGLAAHHFKEISL